MLDPIIIIIIIIIIIYIIVDSVYVTPRKKVENTPLRLIRVRLLLTQNWNLTRVLNTKKKKKKKNRN